MRFEEFRKEISKYPLINRQTLGLIFKYDQKLKNQLLRWKHSGKIISLRKNYYMLNEQDRIINPARQFIACEIYKPTYISLEYALSFYGIIPEKTADLTCVTTNKTQSFANFLGRFVYKHIKTSCFTGFSLQKDAAGLSFHMAVPEKAVTDFIYFHKDKFKTDYKNILVDSYRFDLSSLDSTKIKQYAAFYEDKKLTRIISEVL